MNRFHWVSFSVIVSVTIWSLPSSSTDLEQNLRHQNQSPPDAQSAKNTLVFDDFLKIAGRPKRNGGGRDTDVCTIVPLPKSNVGQKFSNRFLSDRPTFVWLGSAKRLEVRSVRDDKKPIWETDLTPQQEWVTFNSNNSKLLPKQTYNLVLIGTNGKKTEMSFKIAGDELKQVRSELQQQVNQFKKEKQASSTIALKQAIYLGNKGLWLDAYGILFSAQRQELSGRERQDWEAGLKKLRDICLSPSSKKR